MTLKEMYQHIENRTKFNEDIIIINLVIQTDNIILTLSYKKETERSIKKLYFKSYEELEKYLKKI